MQTENMPVLELSGSAKERGRQHGEALRDEISNILEHWKSSLGTYRGAVHKGSPDDYLTEFLAETDFLSAITKYTPDLLDEVRGLSEGANQRFEDMLAMQMVDEEWTFGLRRKLLRPTEKCTGFGIVGTDAQPTMAGQNMDITSWADGYQALTRIKHDEDRPEQMVVIYAGLIGLMGCNAAPLGITCNTLSDLRASAVGLPVAFVVRGVLQQTDLEGAIRFLKRIPHASGQNYILSSPGEVRCFECSAGAVVEYQPGRAGRVFHTNHQLANSDRDPVILKHHPEGRPSTNSEARLNSISTRLMGRPDLSEIKSALSAHDDPDHPVSRSLGQAGSDRHIGFTAASAIYEFADEFRLHLAAGPPCETSFRTYRFS